MTGQDYGFARDEGTLDDYAWHAGNYKGAPQPVGQKLPNRYGLYDMHGNVFEWVADVFDTYDPSYLNDPVNWDSLSSASRVLRGGSFYDNAENVRCANRVSSLPFSDYNNSGFRVVFAPPYKSVP